VTLKPDDSGNKALCGKSIKNSEIVESASHRFPSMHSDKGYVLRALKAGAKVTVETHRRNLQDKLNLRSFAELILYAVRKRVIS
jgi:hypothetical protein